MCAFAVVYSLWLALILRGLVVGMPTARLARELKFSCLRCWGRDTSSRLTPWPSWTPPAGRRRRRGRRDLQDRRGEGARADPKNSPRRRANKKRGHGTWDSDRPPLPGATGRRSKRLRPAKRCYQAQYATVFEWVYNTKRISGELVRILIGLRVVTNPGA
jgi:hypothetical protein